jgi:serine/threonine protein kinase
MDVDAFRALVVASGLVDGASAAEIWLEVDARSFSTADALAAYLVEEQLLTRFQADNLLRGKVKSFVVGEFEIRDFLGRGGMGNVFLAVDRRSGETRAVKILPADLRGKDRSLRRFEREMAVSQKVSHPGVTQTFEAGVANGVPYLAMEYVPGETLYKRIRKGNLAPVSQAACWIAQVADALEYLHQQGVIHRDLKPSNVMITPEGKVKLLDLGLARWFDDDHNEERVLGGKRIVGSFDYIPPEQARNSSSADARSDVYGLGCLLYFSLAGRPPFHGVGTSREKIRSHRRVIPESIRTIRPDVPLGLEQTLERMMAKDPSERFQSAGEVYQALLEWATEEDDPSDEEPTAVWTDDLPSTDEPIPISESHSRPSQLRLWRRLHQRIANLIRAARPSAFRRP